MTHISQIGTRYGRKYHHIRTRHHIAITLQSHTTNNHCRFHNSLQPSELPLNFIDLA